MQGHILAVDDEPNIVRFIQENLECCGYQVETANNGREALTKIKADRPGLLIIDVMMPEMDGFELLANLRRDPALMDQPVIMMVPRRCDMSLIDQQQHYDDQNAQSAIFFYLIKPFSPEALVKAAEHFLPRPTSNT